MHCIQCGTELKQGAIFCQSCGAKIDTKTENSQVKQNSVPWYRHHYGTKTGSKGFSPAILLVFAVCGYVLAQIIFKQNNDFSGIWGPIFNTVATVCLITAIVRAIKKYQRK